LVLDASGLHRQKSPAGARNTSASRSGPHDPLVAHEVGVDLSGLANIAAFRARMAARPAARAAMKEEGLIK